MRLLGARVYVLAVHSACNKYNFVPFVHILVVIHLFSVVLGDLHLVYLGVVQCLACGLVLQSEPGLVVLVLSDAFFLAEVVTPDEENDLSAWLSKLTKHQFNLPVVVNPHPLVPKALSELQTREQRLRFRLARA